MPSPSRRISCGNQSGASDTGVPAGTVGPNIPRLPTRIPVPFATIACSNEILEPSANDVTMLGFWPQRRANSSWVVGFRYGSCRPLMLPQSTGRTPIPFTNRYKFMITPG
jgi:hypothetical protein